MHGCPPLTGCRTQSSPSQAAQGVGFRTICMIRQNSCLVHRRGTAYPAPGEMRTQPHSAEPAICANHFLPSRNRRRSEQPAAGRSRIHALAQIKQPHSWPRLPGRRASAVPELAPAVIPPRLKPASFGRFRAAMPETHVPWAFPSSHRQNPRPIRRSGQASRLPAQGHRARHGRLSGTAAQPHHAHSRRDRRAFELCPAPGRRPHGYSGITPPDAEVTHTLATLLIGKWPRTHSIL